MGWGFLTPLEINFGLGCISFYFGSSMFTPFSKPPCTPIKIIKLCTFYDYMFLFRLKNVAALFMTITVLVLHTNKWKIILNWHEKNIFHPGRNNWESLFCFDSLLEQKYVIIYVCFKLFKIKLYIVRIRTKVKRGCSSLMFTLTAKPAMLSIWRF